MTLTQFPPIEGHEELRYRDEVLQLGPVSDNARLELELVGPQVRLHAFDPGAGSLAWELEAPFGSWPPKLSASPPSTEDASVQGPIEMATWPAGQSLAFATGRPPRWLAATDADVGGASFVCSARDGIDLVLERAERGERWPVGSLALSSRYAQGILASDRTLWLATAERRDHSVVDLFQVGARVHCLGSMPCPALKEQLQLECVLERTGGAWLLYQNRYALLARAVDDSGFGLEWTTWWAVMGFDTVRFARWRDGFVAALVQSLLVFNPNSPRRLLFIATDGEHTTRALGVPSADTPLPLQTAVAVAPDGAAFLVAYRSASGLVVARADFAANANPDDPWKGDAEAIAKAQAAVPTPPDAQDVATEDESEPLFDSDARPSCRQVIETLRRTALETVRFVIAHPNLDEDAYRGDARRGSYVISNGQGDFMVFAWNERGIVATAFDHELSEESDLPIEERKPFRFLGPVPRQLLPLARKAIRLADHSVTGGLWMTDDDGRRGGNLMNLLLYVARSDAAQAGSRDAAEVEWDALSQHLLSATAEVTLTDEDAGMLLAAAESARVEVGRPEPLTIAGVKLAAKKLAKLGITWPDPVGALLRARG